MLSRVLTMSAALLGLLAAGPAVGKAYLYQITDVPNSIVTTVFDINNKGIATGSWLDANGAEHGYVGPPDGSNYATFDDPTDPGTQPRGLDDGGDITGFDNSQSGSPDSYIPFERSSGGTITDITMKGAPLNYLIQGINKSGVFAGSYINASLQVVGYLGKKAKYSGTLKLKGIKNSGVAARGIDTAGDVVGWYYDAKGAQHGFLLPAGGQAERIDSSNPSAVSTALEGINDSGKISGQYTDKSGLIHGFVYDLSAKKFHEIKVPGSSLFVEPWGINNKGWVALGSDVGYFIYCPTFNDCIGTAAPHRAPRQKLRPQLP